MQEQTILILVLKYHQNLTPPHLTRLYCLRLRQGKNHSENIKYTYELMKKRSANLT